MTVLGSAEVELTLDPGKAGQSAERELTSSLESAGKKAGARLESAIGDAGKRAGKTAGDGLSTGVEAGAGDAGKKAGAKIEQGLVAAGKTAGTKAGKAAGDGVEDGVGKASKGIGVAGVAVGSALGAGIAGAAGAALGSLGDLIGGALEAANLPGQLRAKLGVGTAESAQLGKVAGAVYAANYGDSLGQVTDALVLIRRSSALMGAGAKADLQGVTAAALTTAQTIGGDLNQTIEVAGKLVQNGLAPNAKAAFDLLIVGAQRGDDAAGDLLDTFSEYSPQFQKLGLQGPQALGLLDQAIKAGARNTDIAADAIKEFSIRAIDGSTLTAQGFRGLGLDAGTMASRIAAGGKTATGALDQTLDRLRAIPDPVKRSQVAVALFGTQAEDLGQALFALDPSTAVAGLGQVAGAADRAGDALAAGPQAKLDAFTRSLQGKVTTVLGTFVGALDSIPGPAKAAAGTLGAVVAAAGGFALLAGTLGPKIGAAREQLAGLGAAGEKANTTLGKIGKGFGIAGAAIAGVTIITAGIQKLQDVVSKTPPEVNKLTASLLAARSAEDVTKTLGGNIEDLGLAIRRVTDKSNGQKLSDTLDGLFKLQPKSLREATGELDSLDKALTGLVSGGHADEAARQFKLLADAAVAGGASLDDVKKAFPGYSSALAGIANEAKLSGKAQDGQGKSIAGATGDMKDQLSTAERLTAQLDKLSGAAEDNTRADIAVRDAKAKLTQALKDNGRSLDINTPKGRENASALLDARDAAQRYAEAQEKLTPGVGRGSAAFKGYVDQLVGVLRAAHVSEAQIKTFTDTVLRVPKGPVGPKVATPGSAAAKAQLESVTGAAGRIPGAKSTSVSAPGAPDAASKMNTATRAANGIPGAKATRVSAPGAGSAASALSSVAGAANRLPTFKSVTVSVSSRGVASVQREINSITGHAVSIIVGSIREGGHQARMAGGPVNAGTPYLVGEAGPEIVVPARSGTVIPNDKAFASASALGIGGGGRLHPDDIRALAAAIGGAVGRGDVYLGREKVGAAVSRTIGGNVVRAGI